MSAAEDPEKLLDQAVADMQTDLIRLRQSAAQVRCWVLPPVLWRCSGACLEFCSSAWSCCLPAVPTDLLTHPPPLHQCATRLQVTASRQRLQLRYDQSQSTAADWYRRAELALAKGDEELAKEALMRRKANAVRPVRCAALR